MSSITKTIKLTYGSDLKYTTKTKEIKIDSKCSWYTCQTWFNKNMKKDFLEEKYGDNLTITWFDNKKTEFRLRSKN